MNTAASRSTRIVLEGSSKKLNAASRLNTDYEFFEMLRTNGKRATRRFLDAHFDDIGVRSTVDLAAEVKAEWGVDGIHPLKGEGYRMWRRRSFSLSPLAGRGSG